ncbi:MAG: hypothetical protein SVX43_13210 [Cyanobacteriota bacterium]|nr:hypothetical protein [Cyanobacteriota bacterium]
MIFWVFMSAIAPFIVGSWVVLRGLSALSDAIARFRGLRDEPEPEFNGPALCWGCLNFHGKSHGGTLLICAIHPFGPTGNFCGDRIPSVGIYRRRYSL